ncbi:MAG: AAA family ATPase [Treponema sp.]|jgi:SpoVK/Ycf46/Vps4 family AAA+-type ATPase|nr:AAA family ATPase [Treponema sp.]
MSDTLVCAVCGRNNRENAKYCRFCGVLTEPAGAGPVMTAVEPAMSAPQTTAAAPSAITAAPALDIPSDYIGQAEVRKELDAEKRSLKFQRERVKAGVGGAMGRKIFVFRGDTGTGKTLVASCFVKELQREKCLESDRATIIEARKLAKQYADEFALASFLQEQKPAILVVDNATENSAFVHELILAVNKPAAECICVIIGSRDGFEECFKNNVEDRQRVSKAFDFAELSNGELALVLLKKLRESNFVVDPALKQHFEAYIAERRGDSECEYKNGWLVEKDIIPTISKNQEARLTSLNAGSPGAQDYRTILAEDLPLKYKPRTVDEILAELDNMVGLTDVKAAIRGIANKIIMQKKKAEQEGSAVKGEGNNIVITGNPGTGKTTIVRTMAALFKEVELLPSEKFVETDGNGLKGSYVGQSKDKVNELCEKAMGGVLFVDEAYTLANENGAVDSFAEEAATTLMKYLEDRRTEFVGVVAGYKKEMDNFLDKINPGMRRRFKHYLHLPDYTADELFTIFEKFNVEKNGYVLTEEARELARAAIRDMVNNKGPGFGNAGDIRVFYEKITSRQSDRLAKLSAAEQDAGLKTIEAADIGYEKKKRRSVDEVLAELDAMVGMTEVKKAVRGIANKIQIELDIEKKEKEAAEAAGEDVKAAKKRDKEGNNIIITGNPGTGKTTIVRTLGKLFNAMGLLPTETVIETDGNGLKGSYVGQSKDRVNDLCAQAMGGILFVDEAYTLADENGPSDSFAEEAAVTLMKHLEDDRDKFVGIAAGYPKEMEYFLDKINPGMRRRFKHFLYLPDYSAEELFLIFKGMAKAKELVLTADALQAAEEAITDMYNNKGANFGNAGEIRVFLERIETRKSDRLSELKSSGHDLSVEEMKTIEAADIGYEKKKRLSVDEVLAELDAMVGMIDVKKAVREIANKILIQKEIEEKDGTKTKGEGNNIILTGNPGTGKTTIVRTMGKLFKSIGLLPTDNVIEIDGNGLKGSYVGQSKDNVNEYCRKAMGGILFVDEAYTLANERGPVDSFAEEAATTLMKYLEDRRTEFVGIAAGYPKEMEYFLDKINPGMRRRFKHYLYLPDYSAEELFLILQSMAKQQGYCFTPRALEISEEAVFAMHRSKGLNFGNAGEIRVFFEKITTRQSSRLAALSQKERADKLKTIEAEDIPDGGEQ